MAVVEPGPAFKAYAEDFKAFARQVLGLELTPTQEALTGLFIGSRAILKHTPGRGIEPWHLSRADQELVKQALEGKI